MARAFVDVRGGDRGARWRSTSTTWSAAPSTRSRATPALLGAVARTLRPPARRRGPGRRPVAAAPRAPARGAREPDLPRRRRRPVDLRLAPGRRPPGPGPGRRAARPAARRPRGQPPLPGAGRRAGRPPDRAQPRALREGRPTAAGCPGLGSSWRRTRPTSRSGPSGCIRSWPDDDGTRAILARTNRELRPAVVAALALGEPFRAPSVELLVDDPALDGAAGPGRATRPTRGCRCSSASAGLRRGRGAGGTEAERDLAAALLAWAPAVPRPRRAFAPRSRRCAPGWPSSAATTPACQPGDGPLDQGRRVRPRRGRRAWRRAASRAAARSPRRRSRSARSRRSGGWATSPGPARGGP